MDISFVSGPGVQPISAIRKILCTAALAALALGALASTTASGGSTPSPDMVRADLSQAGHLLVLEVRTAAPVPLARLARQPAVRRAGARYLCFSLRRLRRRGQRRLCLGGARGAHRRVGLELVNAAGKTVRKTTLRARVKRPKPRTLVIALPPESAGMQPHRYRWRVLENRRGCRRCRESYPKRGGRLFRLRPVRAVGCTGGGGLVHNGPRDRKAVALTFDDGPSSYTEGFLDVLRRTGAHATFFEIGQEVPGRADAMRRILRDGNEIANHTTHHDELPGYWDLAATNALIRDATGFQPCLFRPPGGAVNSAVVAAAARAGMTTVIWDVDPTDWSNPGSGAVYSRVVGAVRPGSIVVMHDGGGNRSGTLAALPRIVRTLRSRGYRFATVSQLLGHRLIYRPYG